MATIRNDVACAALHFMQARHDLGDFSERTHKAYACDLKQLAAFVGNDIPVENITERSLQAWVAQLQATGYSAASCRRKVAVARCFFNHCVRSEMIETSPLDRLRLRFKAEVSLPRTLGHEELRRMLRGVSIAVSSHSGLPRRRFLAIRNRAILHLLLATGIRVGELTALRVADIDLSERVVHVRGKGGRERLALLESDTCMSSLRAYLELRDGLELRRRDAAEVGQGANTRRVQGGPLHPTVDPGPQVFQREPQARIFPLRLYVSCCSAAEALGRRACVVVRITCHGENAIHLPPHGRGELHEAGILERDPQRHAEDQENKDNPEQRRHLKPASRFLIRGEVAA